jgi:DNA-binding PadR family transcriptional regulator
MRDFIRGAIRLHVLHHASEGGVHGAWLTEELAHHGHKISPGTLYPTLHRMEAEGLLKSKQQVAQGRVRRVYTITPAGRRTLRDGRVLLAELAHEVLGEPA